MAGRGSASGSGSAEPILPGNDFQFKGTSFRSKTILNYLDYGGDAAGTIDSTPAFTAAFAEYPYGCVVCVPPNAKALIDTALTIPAFSEIRGQHTMASGGAPWYSAEKSISQQLSCLIVNPTITISLGPSAGVNGCLVARKGLVYPVDYTLIPSTWLGTAVTSIQQDTWMRECIVVGFNKAFYSYGWQRPKLQDVYIDCVNGVDIGNCYDIARITNVHCWPFLTVNAAAANIRSGTAFYIHDVGDWNKLIGCFSYGYFRGYDIFNASNVSLISCGADGNGTNAGSRGFLIRGSSQGTLLSACQTAGQIIGFENAANAGLHTSMSQCEAWACTTLGFKNTTGDITYNACTGVTKGFDNASATAAVTYIAPRTSGGATIANTGASPNTETIGTKQLL
jgi:hypothetical protein